MTINKSQGQILRKVGLDLRGGVFCHGQLYVAFGRTTCRDNLLCLVRPDRLIDGVRHVFDVVYSEFIVAATGSPPPVFDVVLPRANNSTTGNNGYSAAASTNSPRGNNDTDRGRRRSTERGGEALPMVLAVTVVDEIGDGACLIRCIARRVFNDPGLHFQARQQLLQHISTHLHDVVPGSEFKGSL